MARPWAWSWVFVAAWGMSALSAHALVGYEPFPDAASIQAADELEERLWDEAGATYSQVAGIAKRQTWLHISERYEFKTRAVQERRGRKC